VTKPIAVLGAGGVGGLLAAALDRAGEPVTVVARAATAEVLRRDGLTVQSTLLGEFTARPRVETTLAGPGGALVVATKAPGLPEALERIEGEPELVLPLLNGMDHIALLRARFGPRAVAGTIRVESLASEPGRIEQRSPFLEVRMASTDPALVPAMEDLAATLSHAGVPAVVADSEADVVWAKLVRLNAMALTTSAADAPLGTVRSDPQWRAALLECLREGSAVAHAEGAEIDPDAALEQLDRDHAELRTSMQRDIAAGREPELDNIAGSVLRAASRHGIACPTIARLARDVAARAGIPAPVV
jgi:2-dehydropantoate 2-reductase